jgi:glycosyltransferase involved in cell wall biosynthesis
MPHTRPLRIALLTTFYPPCNFGGDGRYVQSFAHALARAGCEVEIIYDADAWRAVSVTAEIPDPVAEPEGVTVHRLMSGWAMGSTLLTQQMGRPIVQRKAIAALLERDFDVIHYHNISLLGGPGLLEIGDALKFYTAHEHWLVCANHVLWRHNRELCDARACFKCSLLHHRPPQMWRATDLLHRQCAHVDAFIALSQSVATNHKNFGFQREMKLMASFMPDTSAASLGEGLASPHPRPYFLFVGRLETIKGLQDVIPAWNPEIPADLLIAGTGNFEDELRTLAAGKPQVHFLGQIDPGDLPALYRNAVALITPSRCYEVFPMVALEAFKEATPIVARDLGPYPQIVEESGAGLLFDDTASLQSALTRLASDQGLRQQLGANGARAMATLWSETTAIAAYFELIRETAARRGRDDILARVAQQISR